jgi:hypothetical protein
MSFQKLDTENFFPTATLRPPIKQLMAVKPPVPWNIGMHTYHRSPPGPGFWPKDGRFWFPKPQIRWTVDTQPFGSPVVPLNDGLAGLKFGNLTHVKYLVNMRHAGELPFML